MNKNFIVFYHRNNENIDNCLEIIDLCNNLRLHMFDCSKLDVLSYILYKLSPMFVVVSCPKDLNIEIFNEYTDKNKAVFVYIIGDYYQLNKKNVYVLKDVKEFKNVFANHFRTYSTISDKFEKK